MSDNSPKQVAPVGIDLSAVRVLAESVASAHGVEVADVEWTSGAGGKVLRVLIERPMGSEDGATTVAGVTLDDCMRVSRDMSTAIDVEDPISAAYSLEVSSPGLNRPLKTLRDFQRQVGRLAKLKLHEPAPDGQLVLRGTITAVVQDTVVMEVDGNTHEQRLDNVREARLVFEIGAEPPKNAKRGQHRKSPQRATQGRRESSG